MLIFPSSETATQPSESGVAPESGQRLSDTDASASARSRRPTITLGQTDVDAQQSLFYTPTMICAFSRLMKITNSCGFAVGPEGMRVR
jgi:hypothetical protein